RHYTGADPYRSSRIAELLGGSTAHSVADMMRVQNDNVSIPARSIVPLLRNIPLAGPGGPSRLGPDNGTPDADEKARQLLLSWNDSVDADSIAAGIYEMWQRHLATNLRSLLVPKEGEPVIRLL